jgi:hypothetical protein
MRIMDWIYNQYIKLLGRRPPPRMTPEEREELKRFIEKSKREAAKGDKK